uniref:Ring finger protein 150 n=1 Tax=Athene cunicularia TaxID=194338 RepID=A0A663NER3_ATHCN
MTYPLVKDVVAIMIPEPKGKEIVSLLERNITVMMYITIGTRNLQKYVSRTSVVFVSISFIVLMIISLAWLVFYYIQRFRYANARDRNQRRLGDAAKKAISKLQVRTIRKGDKETEPDFDNCAVCIEGYKPNDVVRILPCRHLFHKSCVDPWLLDHRTCPMCKMNILKALGIPVSTSQSSRLGQEGNTSYLGISVALCLSVPILLFFPDLSDHRHQGLHQEEASHFLTPCEACHMIVKFSTDTPPVDALTGAVNTLPGYRWWHANSHRKELYKVK